LTRRHPSGIRPAAAQFYRGICEFGDKMASMMEDTPGAIGAVLADARGEPIDFAHDPERIDSLEIQIVGAQLGQSIERLRKTAVTFGLGHPTVLLHAKAGNLLTTPLHAEYLLTVVLARSANIARAMQGFARLADELRLLLA